jgi:hypothetical protein
MTKKSETRIRRETDEMMNEINRLPDRVSESFDYEGFLSALKFRDFRKAFGVCRSFLRSRAGKRNENRTQLRWGRKVRSDLA